MDPSHGILIVEQERGAAADLARRLRKYQPTGIANSASEAHRLMRSFTPCGAIVNQHLPDGAGLAVAADLRASFTALPILLVTREEDWSLVQKAVRLCALVTVGPVGDAELRAFASQALVGASAGDSSIRTAICDFAGRYELTPREIEIVSLAVRGVPGEEIRHTLRLGPEGWKSAKARLLAKTDEQTRLADVVVTILRWAAYGTPTRAA